MSLALAPPARPGPSVRRDALPCRDNDADLWFSESPSDLERAKLLCGPCALRSECLAGALEREEPWGVWGGEIFERGTVVPRKRPRGRPRKEDRERDAQRHAEVATRASAAFSTHRTVRLAA